ASKRENQTSNPCAKPRARVSRKLPTIPSPRHPAARRRSPSVTSASARRDSKVVTRCCEGYLDVNRLATAGLVHDEVEYAFGKTTPAAPSESRNGVRPRLPRRTPTRSARGVSIITTARLG